MESNKETTFWDYFIILIFFLISGNPEIEWEWKYIALAIAAIVLYRNLIFDKSIQYQRCKQFIIIAIFVFICQFFVFGWNSFPSIVNYGAKIFCAYAITKILGERFRDIAFNVLFFLSIVGLFFYGLYITTGFAIDLVGDTFHKSMFIWGHHVNHELGSRIRNDGAFWEPGAYSGYIMMTLMLFIDDLPNLYKEHKAKLICILVALISTFSTAGYILAFVYAGYVMFTSKARKYLFILLPILIGLAVYVSSLDFMGEKLQENIEATEDVDINGSRVDHGRFTSMVFDQYYIEKHPLVGNGFNSRTRYADHLYMGDENLHGFGNGFTGFLACMGIPFVLLFLFIVYRNHFSSKYGKYAIPLMLVLLLNGEQYQNFPFIYLFMFVVYPMRKDISNVNQ